MDNKCREHEFVKTFSRKHKTVSWYCLHCTAEKEAEIKRLAKTIDERIAFTHITKMKML
jgi:hypothetical protein